MPLSNDELRSVQQRVMFMFMDTIATFEIIEKHAEDIFGRDAPAVRDAIREYLNDFLHNTGESGETHPEVLVYRTSRENFQRAGFYGAQLDLKEKQVVQANATLRDRLAEGVRRLWNRPFRKWVDVINNFLGSIGPATGMSEALRELKDCLRDELPDGENDDK